MITQDVERAALNAVPKVKPLFFIPLTLLALLLVTATLWGVVHHHQNSTSENTCQVCHLNHQPIESPLASDRVLVLIPAEAHPEPDDYEFSPGLLVRRCPVR